MIRIDIFKAWAVFGTVLSAILPCQYFAQASPALNAPIQITSNPGEDFAPTVSADGKVMVYVSDKSGNLDLWLKHLGPGIQPPDKRLTFHSAEDGSPEISPDGKKLAFVSHRSDPRGDIYILDLSVKGEPIPIIQKLGEERDPVWSPDQKALYFSSRPSSSAQPEIEKVELQGGKRTQVLKQGGVNLSLSPDGRFLAFVTGESHSKLRIYNLLTASTQTLEQGPFIDTSPRWSKDGKSIFFTRYQNDSNHDGRLGIDDNPDIWSVDFNDERLGGLRQLTDSSSYDFLPRPLSAKHFLFTSYHNGNSDIWKLPDDGIMPVTQEKEDSLVDEFCSAYKGSYACTLILNNILVADPQIRTRYRLAKQYLLLGHDASARSILKKILEHKVDSNVYQGLAEIELLLLSLKEAEELGRLPEQNGLEKLEKIIADYSGVASVEARGFLEMGNLSLLLNKPALQYYQKVVEQYSTEREISAEAAFSKSRIYAQVGNRNKLVASLIHGMRNFSDVKYWKQQSIEAILKLFEDQPTLEKKVSSLQNLTGIDLPLLSATVQNRIGQLYYQSAENLLAKEAYQKTLTQGVTEEAYTARFALARIYAEEENFEKSLSLYQEMSGELHGHYAQIAREGLIQKTLDKGNWELRVGEVQLARKTFLRLIEFSPETVKAHRGYLQAVASLGRSPQAVKFYKDRVKTKPESAVERYALGLAFTYLDPPALDDAEIEIGKALTQNSQETFYHQTLGWVYEQKERQGPGYIEKALHEYQIALSLNDDEDVRNEADLLLNLGNGHYLLNNTLSAYHYYKKRQAREEPFLNVDRQAVYHKRFGEVAFKSGAQQEAITQFEKALAIAEKSKSLTRMAELHDRIALAYQDFGDYAQAVVHFTQTLELNRQAGKDTSLSRTLRNIANNIYSGNKVGRDSEEMARALNLYFQAIQKLEQFGAIERQKKSSALIDVNIEAGIGDDASSAAYGFDQTGEKKLIFHYIGRIYGDLGLYGKAIDYFQKKLALIPPDLDVDKNVPVLLEKALLLNQLGNYYYQSSNYESSLTYFKKSFELSQKLNNLYGMRVNSANVGRVVLTLSSLKPLVTLKDDIYQSIWLLEKSVATVGATGTFVDPEELMVLHNYLGVLYHFQGFHLGGMTKSLEESEAGAQFKSSLIGLKRQWENIQKSVHHFELALVQARQKKQASMIWQNLQWTRYLIGVKPGEEKPALSIKERWQSIYLQAKQSEEGALPLLLKAEKELSRLPYGWGDRSSLALVEQLYADITFRLFEQEKFASALMFSEKGKKQVQIALAPQISFSDEDRQAYMDEIVTFSQRLKSAPEENVSALLDEYQEFLQLVDEDDPELVDWISSRVPSLDVLSVSSNSRLMKFQRVHNEILVWWVQDEKVQGKRIPGSRKLFELISKFTDHEYRATAKEVRFLSHHLLTPLGEPLGQEKGLLIADGKLEFLPWAAMTWGEKPLLKTFVSSLSHWQRSVNQKNLYNSRLLTLGAKHSEKLQSAFSTVLNLEGDGATVKNFLSNWKHFGVVQVESPVHLNRLDPTSSFITLSREDNRFHRIPLLALYEKPFESHLIMMADVEYEFDPLLSLSATSLLVEGMAFKGYPGILLHTGKPDEKLHHELMGYLVPDLKKGNPAESLLRAQKKVAKKYPDNFEWTKYRYYGFPGMTVKEKEVFAKEHFQSNLQKGASAFKEGNWLVVIDHLEKALVLQSFLPEKKMAGNIYKTLAQAAYNLEDYAKAIRYQQQVLPYSREDPEMLAEALYFLGILYSRAENYSSAVAHLKKSLKIYQDHEILDRLAESYSTLGIVEENALDYDNALKAFNASLAINEEIGEDLNRGRELRRIGRIYYLRLNRFQDAREFFSQALELFTELEQVDQQVESLLELGLVSEKQGDFQQALEFYDKAQSLAEKADLRPGLAKAFLYKANSHWFQANYQQAFKYQRQALEIARELGDKLQQAFILNTLGLIHWTLNDPVRALDNLGQSLELAKRSRSPLDVATAYNNIGLVYRKEKRYPKSIEYFKQALKKDEELKSKWGQGYTHRNLGISFLRMGRLDTAEIHLRKAVDLSREIGNRTNWVKAILELGHLALERKQWKPAITLFREAFELSDQINVKEVSWRALRGEGLALIQLGNNEQALEAYQKAMAVVDTLRAAIKVEEFQNGFLTDKQDVYKELILLLLNMGKVKDSFQYAERAKSRSFIDLLGNQKINLKSAVSRDLYESLNRQKQAILKIEDSLAAARNSDQKEKAKEMANELVKVRNQYQDLLINVKEQSPEISSFVTVEAITLEALQALLEDSVALVEYLVTENELIAWVVTKEKIEVARVPLTEKQLNGFVADYRERIQKLAPVEEQAQRLYSLLIKPVEPYIEKKRILGIVPQGHLHYISFSSLKNKHNFLIEKHPLFYSPSASVMQFTFKAPTKRSGKVRVLALGNPDLGDLNYDLPLAEMEANAIKWNFPQVDVLTRENATESWLQEHISDYQIIHIASHGEFDPVNPLFSSLKLTRSETADGNFEVNEVFGLEINAEIVTLSACQTGLGDIVGGDELVGLNRAFIYAGTQSILSSLWRVSDISTAVLIKHFYRNYGSDNKAESLRKAQLLVKRLYPHPSYWAGLSLTGDYR